MPTEQEIQFHRSFLSLHLCRTIYNEDERYQHSPGGVPGRQAKIESDPVFKYHVHSGPRYPQRSPDAHQKYGAILARTQGNFESFVIIPKRDQRFATAATEWELGNSVLCTGTGFWPVVNSWMEVTGHHATVRQTQLIHPEGVEFTDVADYIANDVPLHVWDYQVYDPARNAIVDMSQVSLPPGWKTFNNYFGGIDVIVLPNGQVIGAAGRRFQSNNGHAVSVMSPLDFWTPGSGMLATAIRGLTNRVTGAVRAGYRVLNGPTKQVAEMAAARVSRTTLHGMAVSNGAPPVKHLNRRTLIMGDDLAEFEPWFAQSTPVSGFYDVFVHADSTTFYVLMKHNGKEVWKPLSVRQVADVVRSRLLPGDQLRLLACEVGVTGGPGQQLANELNHTVWAATTKVPAAPRSTGTNTSSFIPRDGGKFHQFIPERGGARLAGQGGRLTGNEVQGEILPKP